ncbi:MAG: VWA domain-containing protein [Thiogranum sp.]|jgi:Ca-activated chloride channel family protein
MPESFHFLQPLWFLALMPLALWLWLAQRQGDTDSSWRRVCDRHLLPYVVNNPVRHAGNLSLWLLAAGWLLAVTALADPVWQKRPQPVYRNQQALVVVLDLSRSMSSGDLKPSRLDRARYKVADILKQRSEGQTALVVFAGDAFAVSPLTSDTNTIRSLLDPLQPGLMPVQGSRVDLGLDKAAELLKQAGVSHGDILLIADGFEDARALDEARRVYKAGYRVSVLGAGTSEGAPVPDGQGGYVRDAAGSVVMAALKPARLRQLAAAGGGNYSTMTATADDLKTLLPRPTATPATQMAQTDLKTDIWRSEGPWLVLVLLPLAALAFRRGWLLSLPLLVVTVLSSTPQPAMAASWDDLWQRRDQQADAALRAGDLQRAQALARQPQRLGTAAYRAGDYDKALQAFARSQGPQGDYNRANALAQLGRYQDAIAAYDKALKADPGLDDAVYNKAQVEKLLQQQKQNQQQSKNSSGQGKKDTKQQHAGNSSQQQDGGGKQASGNKSRSSATAGNSGKSAQTGKQPGQPGSDEPASGNQAQNAGDQHSPAAETPEPAVSAGKKSAATGASQARRDNTSRSSEQPRQQARAKGTPDTAGFAPQPPVQSADKGAAPGNADPLTREQQQADERWLRRIPDDPGGLLRRKFLYQYSQRERAQQNDNRQNW